MINFLAKVLVFVGSLTSSIALEWPCPWIFMDEPSLPESMLDNKTVD